MFRQLIGPAFEKLSTEIRRLHTPPAIRSFSGQCEIKRGSSAISHLFGWAARLPPAGTMPVIITIHTCSNKEIWSRQFGAHPMQSTLRIKNDLLVESLGLAQMVFRVEVIAERIYWRLVAVRSLGVPFPRTWFDLDVWEGVEDGRYCFNVRVCLRGALLVHYQGWLA